MGYEIDFLLADKHKKFLQIDSITLGVHGQASQSTQNNNFIISLQYLKESLKDGVVFSLLISVKRFFKVILSFLMCVARRAQLTQNKMFVISLQYLKREVNDEVDFLHGGRHENLLQIDPMILIEMVKHFQSSQNSKFTMSVQYLKIEDRGKLIFCMQVSIKVAFNTLGTKVSFFLLAMFQES